MAAILDVEGAGNSKAEIAEAIGDFLEKPKSSGRDYKPVGKGSKKGKGTKRKSDGPKKVSGYIMFTQSIRYVDICHHIIPYHHSVLCL
jgi:hypothetical protein